MLQNPDVSASADCRTMSMARTEGRGTDNGSGDALHSPDPFGNNREGLGGMGRGVAGGGGVRG